MASLSIVSRFRSEQERKSELQAVFVERYGELLQWAMRLTGNDRSAAEELVQDLYVNFARTLPDIHLITNLNGYLYESLANLRLSQKKQAWKHEHDDLDVLEYNSLHSRLRMRRGADTVEAQDQLLRLCRYLCERKQETRSASILLLRYFRDYSTDEIAFLAKMSKETVHVQVGRARKEAHRYLDQPGPARGGSFMQEPSSARKSDAGATGTFSERLLAMIGASRIGDCLSLQDLHQLYKSLSAPNTAQLAHMVSCDDCLTRVSKFLRGDPPDKGQESGSVSGESNNPAKRLFVDAERILRELSEHDPSILVLAVNGDDLLQYQVTAAEMKQVVAVPAATALSFVEVFNKVGVRLLKIDVLSRPPEGPAEIRSRVTLAYDRVLLVAVEWFGTEQRIRLEYAAASEAVEPSILTPVPPVSARPQNVPAQVEESAELWPSESLWKKIWGWFTRDSIVPAAAIAVILVFGVLLCMQLESGHSRPPDIASVMVQARQTEALSLTRQDVSHRILSFEEHAEDGRLLNKGRIEVWQSGTKIAIRAYDAHNALIGGEWRDGTAGDRVLDHGRLQAKASGDCLHRDIPWSCDVSATTFEALASGNAHWEMSENDGHNLVRITNADYTGTSQNSPRLIRAELDIDQRTHRATAQRLWASVEGATCEYRYVELKYEPNTGLKPDAPVFRPDYDIPASATKRSAALPVVSPSHLAHLQLQALLRLHSINVGSEIQVERTSSGRLFIHGVLASDERVKNIRSSLSDIVVDPFVKMEVYSVDELSHMRRGTQASAISVEGYSIDATQRPADRVLRSHFESLGYHGQQLDEQIRSYTGELEDDAADALQHAWELRDFSRSFTARELASLPEQDRKNWVTLLSEHERDLNDSLVRLQQKSSWLFVGGDTPHGEALAPSSLRPATTQETIDSVFRDVSETNSSLRSLLMASPDVGGGEAVSPQQVSHALSRARSSLSALQVISAHYQAQISRP